MIASSRLRVLLALLLAVALLAACGGDDGESAADDTTSTTAGGSEAEPDDGGEDTTTSDPSTETTTGDDTDDTSEGGDDGTDPTFTGDADSEWCGTYQQLQDLPDPFGGESTPEQAAEMFDQAILLGDRLVDAAPPDIADATERAAGALRTFDDILAAYDYDFARLSEEATPEEIEQLEDPELQEASEDLEAYASQVCGID